MGNPFNPALKEYDLYHEENCYAFHEGWLYLEKP